MRSMLWVLLLGAVTTLTVPALAQDGDVILNPGTLSGSVSMAGYQIASVTVYAIDTVKVYSATTTVDVAVAADSVDYVLTVEGDRDYYVMARARVSAPEVTYALFPVSGPVNVPIGGDVPLGLSMDPAFMSGTISTGSDLNMLESYAIYAYVGVPEFDDPPYYNYISASHLGVPGDTGRDYTLLLTPGAECDIYAHLTVDDLTYRVYDYDVIAPAAGETLYRDYAIDVTAAAISGTALLEGIDVTYASIYGYANSPHRNQSSPIPDVSTGLYTLGVDAGDWRLSPSFSFTLPGAMSGLTGSLRDAYTPAITVNTGDQISDINFLIEPGFFHGTLNLWGANTNFSSATVQASATSGAYATSAVDPGTGDFLFVCSPGDWQTDYYQRLYFDYPDESDTSLGSSVYQRYYSSSAPRHTVAAGQTAPSIDLTYGTITVRRYFYVAGGGTLRSPSIKAIRWEQPYSEASGYGSSTPTTEGQAIVTLLLPGTYTIEAFAYVDGSNTEFGSVDITVDEGDVVVIGGSDRPTVQLTNPTSGQTVCGDTVTVEGTVIDDYGVASITINGEDVAFDPSQNPVQFSHEVALELGENLITIVVTDTDMTEPVVLTTTVISTTCGETDPPVVTLSSPIDGETTCGKKATIEGTITDDQGIASITINGEDVAFDPPANPGDPVVFSHEVVLTLGENLITIVVQDLDQTEPVVLTTTVISEDCGNPCPVVTLNGPEDGQTIDGDSVVVHGTATDDVGIASITINGEAVSFESVGDPEEPGDTVEFSQVIGLDCGENVIEIVVSDVDENEPTVISTTVISTACGIGCAIDIYPNRSPNLIYLETDYTIYVALLGAEDFAVTDVDPSTVYFGRTGTEASPTRSPSVLDIDGDGYDDALFGFLTLDCGFEPGDSTGSLTGQTTSGMSISESDSVTILP